MKIGLIIAIEREMMAFLKFGGEVTTKRVGGRDIYSTKMFGHEVSAVMSGYGEIDAAASTQLLILETGCDIIMNFGVTGALIPELGVEDLFVVSRVLNYDFDISPIDPVEKYQYLEYPDIYIPVDGELVEKATTIMPKLKKVTVASGGRFIEKKEDKDALAALGCQICDMEAAAIARICLTNGIKCLSIKCISDTYAGDGGDFNQNVIKSAEVAFDVLKEIIKAF